MKFLKALIIVMSLQWISFTADAAYIFEGEQITYDFDSSYLLENQTPSSTGSANFSLMFANTYATDIEGTYFYSGNLSVGDSLQIDLYDNKNDEQPFESYILDDHLTPSNGLILTWTSLGNNFSPWTDLEGSIAITVLTGEIEIANADLNIFLNSGEYSPELTVTAVPLPPSLPLLLSSLFGFILFTRRKSIKN